MDGNMEFYRHVIWDWNGTLLNDARLSLDVYNSIAADFGLESVGLAQYRDEFGFPVIDFYKRHGFDFDKIDFREVGRVFIERYLARLDACPLHDGARDILRQLQSLGFTQSVLSANNDRLLKRAVERFGLSEFFTRVDGLSDIYANSKTELAKAHIAALSDELALAPRDAIMAGDTLHDEDAACAMNVDCALIARGHNSAKKLAEAKDAAVFDSHQKFFNFLAHCM